MSGEPTQRDELLRDSLAELDSGSLDAMLLARLIARVSAIETVVGNINDRLGLSGYLEQEMEGLATEIASYLSEDKNLRENAYSAALNSFKTISNP